MKTKSEQLELAARVSSDGYSLQFYCNKECQTYNVAVVNDKVKNKEYYNQIIISRDSLEKIKLWLLKATEMEETNLPHLYVECVSHCEILSFSKLDNCIYVQLYQVASSPKQKRGKTEDEGSMAEKVAGVLARTLSVHLHTSAHNS